MEISGFRLGWWNIFHVAQLPGVQFALSQPFVSLVRRCYLHAMLMTLLHGRYLGLGFHETQCCQFTKTLLEPEANRLHLKMDGWKMVEMVPFSGQMRYANFRAVVARILAQHHRPPNSALTFRVDLARITAFSFFGDVNHKFSGFFSISFFCCALLLGEVVAADGTIVQQKKRSQMLMDKTRSRELFSVDKELRARVFLRVFMSRYGIWYIHDVQMVHIQITRSDLFSCL